MIIINWPIISLLSICPKCLKCSNCLIKLLLTSRQISLISILVKSLHLLANKRTTFDTEQPPIMPDHCDRSLWHIIMRYHYDRLLWQIDEKSAPLIRSGLGRLLASYKHRTPLGHGQTFYTAHHHKHRVRSLPQFFFHCLLMEVWSWSRSTGLSSRQLLELCWKLYNLTHQAQPRS